MRSVIIDTDPGADDALALMMAINSPDLLVEGLTTVGGNATLSETTDNALRLIEHLDGKQSVLPIAVGADRPMRGSFTHAYHVHGSEGLGVRLPEPTLKPHRLNAVEFIQDRVSRSSGQLTIIAIGPLTNVAAALDNRPDIVGAVTEIVVMGWGGWGPGQQNALRRVQYSRGPLGRQRRVRFGRAGHTRRSRRDPPDFHAPAGRAAVVRGHVQVRPAGQPHPVRPVPGAG